MSETKNSKELGTLEPPADPKGCVVQCSSLPLVSLPFCGFHLLISHLLVLVENSIVRMQDACVVL